jgi:pimeloyl-ACP methyl ester carboxylesterase
MIRFLKWSVLVLFVSTLACLGAGLVYRAWMRDQAERQLKITSPRGIDEGRYVTAGGLQQWVTIRGQDRSNPVLFVVHGGPGEAESPFAGKYLPYEQHYTVVQWDQPGAGRTFIRNGQKLDPRLSLAEVAADGVAVAEAVRTRMHARRIVLLGWSWGSLVGIEMIRSRPDLFAAYVGTGQLVDMQKSEAIGYRRVLDRARRLGNRDAVEELERSGPPPYARLSQMIVQRKWSSALSGRSSSAILMELLLAPRYGLSDAAGYVRGLMACRDHFIGPDMKGEMVNYDLGPRGVDFRTPVFVIQGADDDIASPDLARTYLDELTAPAKGFVSLQGAGHGALVDRPDLFLPALDRVLGPALRPGAA